MMQRLNLAELDRQLINCTTAAAENSTNNNNKSSSISYGQLYDIARSIIAIDFDLSNKSASEDFQDREEFEKTLTKILQLCQTIIDFLLADIKRLEMERSEPIGSRNSLIQENRKLRKLLQLQQKAIIYRRIDLVDTTRISAISNHTQDEDDGSLENLDQLSLDSKSTAANNNSMSSASLRLQCMYCSKGFQDPTAFTKHLQLRHLISNTTGNLDQSLSLSSSLSSNLNLIQRMFQQHLATHQNKLAQNSNVAQEKVDILQNEIKVLREKLGRTERQLLEEKEARTNFENDLKITFQQEVMSVKMQLEEKIAQIRILQERDLILVKKKIDATEEKKIVKEIQEPEPRLPKIDQSKDDSSLKPNRRKIEQTPKKEISLDEIKKSLVDNQQELDVKIESKMKARPKEEKRLENQPKPESSIRPSKSLDNIGQMEEKQPDLPAEKDHLKQSLRMELISQVTSKRRQKKEEKTKKEVISSNKNKLERTYSVEIEPEEEPVQQQETKPVVPVLENENQTKAEIYESIEARLKSYIGNNHVGDKVKEQMFDRAMDQIQQDRNLLIQQSRHDYDFVNIEESIRDMIASKVKFKMNGENTDSEPIILEPEVPEEKSPPKTEIVEVKEDESQNEKSTKIKFDQPKLKSILKDRTVLQKPTNKRNITFNNEIIEYEISPLVSEDEMELQQLIDGKPEDSSNQIFLIQQQHQEDDHRSTLQPMNGEKIFIDHDLSPSSSTTSSTTASDDETEQNCNKESNKNSVRTTVDVHQAPKPESVPVPARRRTVPNQTSATSTSTSEKAEQKSNRVSELTELIERKLQNPQLLVNNNGGGQKKLPPLGSIDSLMMSMRSRPQTSVPPAQGQQRKPEENSHSSRHSLDAYDLYEF